MSDTPAPFNTKNQVIQNQDDEINRLKSELAAMLAERDELRAELDDLESLREKPSLGIKLAASQIEIRQAQDSALRWQYKYFDLEKECKQLREENEELSNLLESVRSKILHHWERSK